MAGAAEANGQPGAEVFVQLSAGLYHSAAPPIDGIFGVRGGRVLPALLISDPRVHRFYELICGSLHLSAVTDSYPRI